MEKLLPTQYKIKINNGNNLTGQHTKNIFLCLVKEDIFSAAQPEKNILINRIQDELS
jgi:hypothetical protein